MNEQMGDPLIRLAGRTMGLLPVLQPRLLSMFAAEESPEGSPAGSPPTPNSGGAGVLCDRSTLPLTRLPRSLMSAIVDPIPLTPLVRGDRRDGDLPGGCVSESLMSGEPDDRPHQELELRTNLVPITPALQFVETDLRDEPRTSFRGGPETRQNTALDPEKSTLQPLVNSTLDQRSQNLELVTAQNPISLSTNPAERLMPTERDEINSTSPQSSANNSLDERTQDLEFVTVQNSMSINANPSERLIQRERDDRPQQSLERALTTSTPIARPTSETLADALGEPIGIVQPNPTTNSGTNHQTPSKHIENKIIHDPQSVSTDLGYEPRNSFQGGPETQQDVSPTPFEGSGRSVDSLGLLAKPPGTGIPLAPLVRGKRRMEGDLEPNLELGSRQDSIAFNSNALERLGEPIGRVQPNPTISSSTNHQNQSKQIETPIIPDPQSVSIVQPALDTLIRDAVSAPIGQVQPNPNINHQINRTNPSKPEPPIESTAEMLDQFKNEILPDLQSISTSRTPLKVPLTKGDLGGSSFSNPPTNQTTIAITIGRISVRGVPPAAPPPSRSTRSHRPQVSLNDYLKARNGGNG